MEIEDIKSKSNKLITLGEFVKIVKKYNLNIPLIQRNYKWPAKDGEISAKKLIDDIISNYQNNIEKKTLGMITLKANDDDEKIYILDGQQRLITITIIVKVLGELDNWLKFSFERDENESNIRYNYLFDDGKCDGIDNEEYVDICRMKQNETSIYNAIKEVVDNTDITLDKIYSFILNNVYIVYRNTKGKALDEFLNMNANKTPFHICDYAKYHLIINTNSDKQKKQEVLTLWQEIGEILYNPENQKMFDIISKGYSEDLKRVKMNILFADRYSLENKKEMEDNDFFDNEIKRLRYYKNLLSLITAKKEKLGRTILSLFNVFYKNNTFKNTNTNTNENKKFFEIITNEHIEDNTSYLEILTNIYNNNIENNHKNFSYMMEAFFGNRREFSDEDYIESELDNEFINYQKECIKEMLEIFKEIEFSNTSKNQEIIEISDSNGIVNTNQTKETYNSDEQFPDNLEALLNKFDKIVIPNVQRDYMFGGEGNYMQKYFGVISNEFIQSYREDIKTAFDIDIDKGLDYDGRRVANYILKKGYYYTSNNSNNKFDVYNLLFKKDNYSKIKILNNIYNLIKILSSENNVRIYGEYAIEDKSIPYTNSKQDKFKLSCIMGAVVNNTFFVYDGQQRLTTSVLLCAYLIKLELHICGDNIDSDRKKVLDKYRDLLHKFEFYKRANANKCIKYLLDTDTDSLAKDAWPKAIAKNMVDHSTHSIYSLIKHINEVSEQDDFIELSIFTNIEFIMKYMIFETVITDKVDDAEQLFIDMNEGVKLEEYEIYKAKSNHIIGSITGENKWAKYVDNKWVNMFYKMKKEKNSNIEQTLKDAEVQEMEYIKVCLYMSYNEYCLDGINLSADEILDKIKDKDIDIANNIINRAKDILNITYEVIINKGNIDENFEKVVINFIGCINEYKHDQIKKWTDYTLWLRYICVESTSEFNSIKNIANNNFYILNPKYLVKGEKRYLQKVEYEHFNDIYYKNIPYHNDIAYYIAYYEPILHNNLNYCKYGYLEKFKNKVDEIAEIDKNVAIDNEIDEKAVGNTEETSKNQLSESKKIYNKLLDRRFRLNELEVIKQYEDNKKGEHNYNFNFDEIQLNDYIMPYKYRLRKNELLNIAVPKFIFEINKDNLLLDKDTFMQNYTFSRDQIRYILENNNNNNIQRQVKFIMPTTKERESDCIKFYYIDVFRVYNYIKQHIYLKYDINTMNVNYEYDDNQIWIWFTYKQGDQQTDPYQFNKQQLLDTLGINENIFNAIIEYLNYTEIRGDDLNWLNNNSYTYLSNNNVLSGNNIHESINKMLKIVSKTPNMEETQYNLKLINIEKTLAVYDGNDNDIRDIYYCKLMYLNRAINEYNTNTNCLDTIINELGNILNSLNSLTPGVNIYQEIENLLIDKYIYLQKNNVKEDIIKFLIFMIDYNIYIDCKDKYFFKDSNGSEITSIIPYLCMGIMHLEVTNSYRKNKFNDYYQNKSNYCKEAEYLLIRCFKAEDYHDEHGELIVDKAEYEIYMNKFGINTNKEKI